MERELDALVASAAEAIAAAMRSRDWDLAELHFRYCFANAGVRGGYARQLERDRRLLTSGECSDAELCVLWSSRLRRKVRELPGLAGELHELMAKLAPEESCDGPGPGVVDNAITGGTVANAVMAGSIGSVTINHHAAHGGPAGPDGWLRADQLRRLALGVRPARRFDGEPGLPPYVTRDCDDELSVLLKKAAHHGGLVIVTGEPLSGKTSTAWAALRTSVADDARVLLVRGGADLRGLPDQLRGRDTTGTYVVWLDDLEGHLAEPGTPGVLAQLTQDRVPVLATMRDEAYDRHRFGHHPAARVLSVARTVEVATEWSGAELARLAEVDDPRLVDALRWRGGLGVTECLAAGPEFRAEWRRAARRRSGHRTGHFLVRTAVDLARCGITEPVSSFALYAPYLARGIEEGEPLQEALAWAVKPRHSGIGLLVPGEEPETYRAYGSLVADAVRLGEAEPVPTETWTWALELASHIGEQVRATVGTAFRASFTPRAEAGDIDAMMLLGDAAETGGATGEALHWFREAADNGSARGAEAAGILLHQLGDDAAAIPYLEVAAEQGAEVAATLGRAHHNRAVHWYREAADDRGHVLQREAAERLRGPLVLAEDDPDTT